MTAAWLEPAGPSPEAPSTDRRRRRREVSSRTSTPRDERTLTLVTGDTPTSGVIEDAGSTPVLAPDPARAGDVTSPLSAIPEEPVSAGAIRTRRKPCKGCGGEKPPGKGVQYCESCKPAPWWATHCKGCGETKDPAIGKPYCEECSKCARCREVPRKPNGIYCEECAHEVRRESERARRRTREERAAARSEALRKPCRICTGEKSPGNSSPYCEECRDRRKQRAPCAECHARPRRAHGTRYCEVCIQRLRIEQGSARTATPTFPDLPLAPLAAAVSRVLARTQVAYPPPAHGALEETAARLGVTAKTIREWVEGKRQVVRFDVADKVLAMSGWNWWDIWVEPEPPAERGSAQDVLAYLDSDGVHRHLLASAVFGGDEDAAALVGITLFDGAHDELYELLA